MRYRTAFDDLTGYALPRRKYAPRHWLTRVYFAGSACGHRAWCALARSPLTVFARGVRDGWREWR